MSNPQNTTTLIVQPSNNAPALAGDLPALGQVANEYARRGVVADYLATKASNTIRAQAGALHRFAAFLATVGGELGKPGMGRGMAAFADAVATWAADAGDRAQPDPEAWRGVTWGIVQGFRDWQMNEGDAVSTVNLRLSAVKVYAKLAMKAEVIPQDEQRMIATVTGYARKETKRVNDRRAQTRQPDAKKAEHQHITLKQADALKDQPDTPQGRRDALMMCLLLDHGLRCGEVAGLTVGAFDLEAGTMTFYRPKVDKVQTHELTPDTLAAIRSYMAAGDAPLMLDVPILRGSRKNGALTAPGMSERAITGRVRTLGAENGLESLSAHDCRHYWATYWAGRVDKLKRGLFTLQEAGGWNSLTMPRRYTEAAAIANEGMA